MNSSTPGLPVHHQLLEFTQTYVHRVGGAIQPSSSVIPFSSCPQSLPESGSFPVSQLFRMRWPKYWSFSFSISPSKEHPGRISLRMIWLDLLAVQGTLRSLLQHHSSRASTLLHSAFFTVQLSHPYMTTCPITSWQMDGKKVEAVTDFIFFCLQNHCRVDCSHKNCLLLGRKAMTNLDSILKNKDISLQTK